MDEPRPVKPRAAVETAATAVYEWLMQPSELRRFLAAASDGAMYLTASVHTQVTLS